MPSLSSDGRFTGAANDVYRLYGSRCVSYRVYDPSYRDYHLWDDHETVYYNRWAEDTHREHREYRQLNDREQAEYWNWRHQHSDKD
jgi:hypothetical protein